MATFAQPIAPDSPAHGAASRGRLLRRALQADATLTTVFGALFAVSGGRLAPVLGLPAALLAGLGAALLLYAVALWYAATRPAICRRFVWFNIALAAVWVAESVALLAFGWLPLTPVGWWLVVALAVAVDALATAQYFGVRRS